MDFTFGIITNGSADLNPIIDSIEKQNIPNYEIIIVGGHPVNRKNVNHIPFNENLKPMWITKKKNTITLNAKYENIVYMHDYIYLLPGWYEGHIKFGDNFYILMDKILNIDNTRFRDWTLWVELENDMGYIMKNRHFLLPYNMDHLSKYMYVSGAYWIGKKDVMMEFPLNEKLSWGQSEDVEWSKRIREKYNFSMNINSIVKFMKYKDICGFFDIDDISNRILKNKI